MKAELAFLNAFPHPWSVELLNAPPLIAPVRQYTYPLQIAGEEDALGRGALLLMVTPAAGGTFLATCALGFTDPSMPTGAYACPRPEEVCAVAGGYAYVFDTSDPLQCTHVALKPVVEVRVFPELELLVFVGFHSIVAWGKDGLAWQTQRLSWEGLKLGEVVDGVLHGLGWNMMTDKEVPFTVDLRTGTAEGGAFKNSSS